MCVTWNDLQDAMLWINVGGVGEHQAYLDKETGRIYVHTETGDNFAELPDDIDDEKYVEIPHKRDLGLGKPLVTEFARQFMPGDYDDVRAMFGRKGAYARFKALLVRRNVLDRWYDFEAMAEKRAYREWCEANSIEVSD